MAPQDIADSLITDRQAEVGQGADDPVIAPGAILLRHTHDQGLQLRVDPGAARSLTLLGAIKLLGDQFAVPGEDSVRFDDRGDFRQRFLAQLLADLR